eukprot:TRINITY_DN2484_c0_g1_i2.p1 TRINITY_DN2484_c0_g1~~TRINITY_DN2484_c0_g1_i2.p1  ORF type:complete len:457 (-),score=121.31 TRINITY_DN2484_c0_g1_i2:82-1452(-)
MPPMLTSACCSSNSAPCRSLRVLLRSGQALMRLRSGLRPQRHSSTRGLSTPLNPAARLQAPRETAAVATTKPSVIRTALGSEKHTSTPPDRQRQSTAAAAHAEQAKAAAASVQAELDEFFQFHGSARPRLAGKRLGTAGSAQLTPTNAPREATPAPAPVQRPTPLLAPPPVLSTSVVLAAAEWAAANPAAVEALLLAGVAVAAVPGIACSLALSERLAVCVLPLDRALKVAKGTKQSGIESLLQQLASASVQFEHCVVVLTAAGGLSPIWTDHTARALEAVTACVLSLPLKVAVHAVFSDEMLVQLVVACLRSPKAAPRVALELPLNAEIQQLCSAVPLCHPFAAAALLSRGHSAAQILAMGETDVACEFGGLLPLAVLARLAREIGQRNQNAQTAEHGPASDRSSSIGQMSDLQSEPPTGKGMSPARLVQLKKRRLGVSVRRGDTQARLQWRGAE